MKAITNLCLLWWAACAAAQGTLEVIPLRHRMADQVIPVLQPLVEPGGALTGQGAQLIVRTSPENLAQIRQALAALDQPQRRLMISVRFDESAERSRFGADADVRISNRGAAASARVDSTRSSGEQRVDQQVQALEGGRAHISTGTMRFYSEASTGFDVLPRLAGANVTLEIYAQQERYARGGAIQAQRADTVVRGRLGEWIELVGADSAGGSVGGGGLSTREMRSASSRRMWLKVEELR